MSVSPKEKIIDLIIQYQIEKYLSFGTKSEYKKEDLDKMSYSKLSDIYDKLVLDN